MIASIAGQLCEILRAESNAGGTEPQIIERFTTKAPLVSLPPRVTVESVFVHQKPYAYFVKPADICGKSRVELGDILFIIKRLQNGKVRDYRFTFAQAKRLTNGASPIEVHQFRFYRDVADIDFKFGNSVFQLAGISPITWKKLSASSWFGHYLFLNTHWPIVSAIGLIDAHFPGGCSAFPFSPLAPHPFRRSSIGTYSFDEFLLKFLQLRGVGVGATSRSKEFLEIILKRVGWVVDPPEETKGFFDEVREGGFAIIRVTITDEE